MPPKRVGAGGRSAKQRMARPRRRAAEQVAERVTKFLEEGNDDELGSTIECSDEFREDEPGTAQGEHRKKIIEVPSKIDQIWIADSEELEKSDSDYSANVKTRRKKRKHRFTNQRTGKEMNSGSISGSVLQGRDDTQKGKSKKFRGLEWETWEEGLKDWEVWRDDSNIDVDEIVKRKEPLDLKEPSTDMLMPLLPFQREWLGWSLKQESSPIKGGILADEMGMGKTIQAISLILSSRAICESNVGIHANDSFNLATSSVQDPSLNPGAIPCSNGDLPEVKATLVVCPLVAVIQWRNEIARFTKEGSVKVLIYHGSKRCNDLLELAGYDIVLTTYAIVESEHRINVLPAKQQCKWCQKRFYPAKMAVHVRYYCGPTARKSEKQAKQVKKVFKSSGLISSMENSCTNIKSSDITNEKQKMGLRQSTEVVPRRENEKIKLVASESSLQEGIDSVHAAVSQSSKGFSFLHSVKWNRVILDEAHAIKDRRCSTAKAVFALKSNYKWALSGTPLQNRVGELYSLVRFLEIEPFSYYYCRICDCKSLDYSFGNQGRKCIYCQHSPLHHFCWWNKYIANPIKAHGYVGKGRKAMLLLKYKLLDTTLLRRTKIECASDLALPPRINVLRRDAFDTREEDFYQALYTQSQSQFNTYVSAGTLLNNYAHIFDLLTRLRQAVNHPYLVVYSGTSIPYSCQTTFDPSSLCGVCKDPAEESVITKCNHSFCKSCIKDYISAAGELSNGLAPPCPTCQMPLTVDLTASSDENKLKDISRVKGYKRTSILNRINLKEFQTSTKIDALREEIVLMLHKDAAAKAIVFSQFTSFLDLISYSLEKSNIKCVKLDGSMSIVVREQMIENFTHDADCKVFLMSLKAGGVALNLTVASHVFLMDPWWNPAVEQQAQDRIHRLGQYKPMRVVRFIIEYTIEERILRLQEKKQLVFEGTVGGSSEAFGRLTEADLRFLFTS